jgi:ATP-dependent exoDNAse (exonuclease V) alpha subunit
MVQAEKKIVQTVLDGQGRAPQLMSIQQAIPLTEARPHLNSSQRITIEQVLTSRNRIQGLQGRAGSGKTSTLESIRQGAERSGYVVEGFAPTSRAARQLRDAGISADTLQCFLARSRNAGDPAAKHLYMVDESSLASTRQMRDFLEKIGSQDKVLLIGDIRQHQGVDAGKPFEQLQQAGMQTARLDQIVRQKDPELLRAVAASRGNAAHVLRDTAEFYKVDVAAITATVKQEFASKEKAKAAKRDTPKPPMKATTKTAKRVAA